MQYLSLDEELKKIMECVGLIHNLMNKDNADKLELLDIQRKLLARYNRVLKIWNEERNYSLYLDQRYSVDYLGERD